MEKNNNTRSYYIHKGKLVEFFGTHPVIDEDTILEVAHELSMQPIPELTDEEDAELTREALENKRCTYCDSVEHKWEDCPDANDEQYDDIKQSGFLK